MQADFVHFDYDADIEYLLESPENRIYPAWSRPENERGGSLFRFAARAKPGYGFSTSLCNGITSREDGKPLGCLTLIRETTLENSSYSKQPLHACTDELTERIHKDERIPYRYDDLRKMDKDKLRETLLVFKSYQVEIDEMYDSGALTILDRKEQ